MKRDDVILVRGGGDLATGTIHRLWSAGLKVLVFEAEHPAAIRRQVSVSEAVYEGGAVVEGMRAALVKTLDERDYAIYQLMIGIQPGNLEMLASQELTEEETDVMRAQFIRENLPSIE